MGVGSDVGPFVGLGVLSPDCDGVAAGAQAMKVMTVARMMVAETRVGMRMRVLFILPPLLGGGFVSIAEPPFCFVLK